MIRSMEELEHTTAVQIPLDVRGWEVRTSHDGEEIGKVHDVLVDEEGAARYLDVNRGILKKHVLVPVGLASTDAHEDVIWIRGLDAESLDEIPAFRHDAESLGPEEEESLADAYDRVAGAPVRMAAGERREALGTSRVELARLSELDEYRVIDEDPDPRGWEVVGGAGERLGEVRDLMVDPQALEARYLDVELDQESAGGGRVLVPVEHARTDGEAERVRIAALSRSSVRDLPRYGDEGAGEDYRQRVRRSFSRRFRGSSRYMHPRYDWTVLYAARMDPRPSGVPESGRRCDVRLCR